MNNVFCSSRFVRITLAVVLALGATLAAETITGTVTNKTTNKPSAGDVVVLIKLQQGMQEAARATTDAHGKFTLTFDEDGAQHLVRVNHQKTNYFQPAPRGTHEVQVEVYDSAPKVSNVTSEAYVLRMQTSEGQLQVTQLMGIKNDSNPPRSQMSPTGFDLYIPENATVDGAVAGGPGGMPVTVSAVPLEPKGHYGVIFPIRPGETRIQLVYHLPYNGSASFSPHITLPTDNAAVLLPKSMKIESSALQQAGEEGGAVVYMAKNVQPSQHVDFTVSGNGTLPDMDNTNGQENASNDNSGNPAVNSRAENRPGGGIGTPGTTPDPLDGQVGLMTSRWWIFGGFGILLLGGAAFLVVTNRSVQSDQPALATSGAAAVPHAAASGTSTAGSSIGALKEELFRLETEKLQGQISEEEYAQTKAALDVVLRRALGQSAAKKPSA